MRTPRQATSRLTLLVATSLALLVALTVVPSGAVPSAAAAARWAPAVRAKIHPGVQMYTSGAQCTGNFVFADQLGRVYVGYAAHCAGTGAATDTNGCKARSLPLGTRVRFAHGGSLVDGGTTVGHGQLAYSSWRAMRRLGTRDRNLCDYNDFALVRVGRTDRRKVNPSVPFWGGPTGLHRGGTSAGDPVYSYGGSSLRAGIKALSPKRGTSLGSEGRGWSHSVYTVTPGVPGDSGSGFLDARGNALGTLSTVMITPFAGSNGVGDLRHELHFAQRHAGIPGLRLVRGTVGFSPVP